MSCEEGIKQNMGRKKGVYEKGGYWRGLELFRDEASDLIKGYKEEEKAKQSTVDGTTSLRPIRALS